MGPITPPNKTQAGFNALLGLVLLLFVGPRIIRLLGGVGAILAIAALLFVGVNVAFYLGWHGPAGMFEVMRACPHCNAAAVRKQDRFCRVCGKPVG